MRESIAWKFTGTNGPAKKYYDALGNLTDERAEGLPPKFHQDSQLTAEVSAKQTTFDFDLKSDGSAPPRPAPTTFRGPLG